MGALAFGFWKLKWHDSHIDILANEQMHQKTNEYEWEKRNEQRKPKPKPKRNRDSDGVCVYLVYVIK